VPRLLTGGMPAMATSAGHNHPTAALWPVGLRAPLRAFLDSGATPRVRDFLEQHQVARVAFPDDRAFRNINTAADLAAAEAMLG
jgi:molybdenum cofactor guanylyltransferase